MTRTLRNRALGAVALASVGLAAAGCGGGGAPANQPPREYVALGDSYAAGPGITPVVDPTCLRSGANAASLIATKIGSTNLIDASCAGANTSDLLAKQTRDGTFINRPQFESLTVETRLVTMAIGINDTGLSVEAGYVCLLPQQEYRDACREFLAQPDSVVSDQVAVIARNVSDAIDEIRDRAPKAQVVLIGYPRALPDRGTCPDRIPLTGKAAERQRFTARAIDQAYQALAEAQKVDYVDLYAASVGHDICSEDPWVNGLDPASSDGAQLHPTVAYQQAVADRVVALVEK